MFPIYFFIAGVVSGLLHIYFAGAPALEAFLRAILVWSVGGQGIMCFVGHFFKSDECARGIGWPEGNPFQKEVAFANLAFGVLGMMCLWFSGVFWLAVIVGQAVFMWGAAYMHVVDIKRSENKHLFNAGPILYTDIFIPLLLLILYCLESHQTI